MLDGPDLPKRYGDIYDKSETQFKRIQDAKISKDDYFPMTTFRFCLLSVAFLNKNFNDTHPELYKRALKCNFGESKQPIT